MATVTKDFRLKAGLVVEGSTATVAGKNIITAGTVDAKGDLIVGSADDAVARLGVGTNGQVLTAASGATYGLQWADPAAVGVFDTQITFEGATADAYETTLTVTDPTADRTITLPNASGTVALTTDIPSSTDGLSEGSTNKYFTDERAQDAIGSNVGTGLSYDDATGAISVNTTTIQARVTNVSDTEIGYLDGVTSSIQTQLGDKAPLASPTFTGTVTLPANTITNTMMADNSVDTAEIANNAVTNAKLADDAVDTAEIKNNAVTNAKLADDAVDTAEIKDGAVTSAKIANDTIVNADINTAAAIDQSKISGLTTDLSNKLALAGGTMSGAIAMGTNKITGLGTPTSDADAATKSYVDSASQGIDWKASVRAATTGNVTLASALENGDVLDGVTLATGNRILVKDQSTGSENGIYVVKASGAPDRSTDADTASEVTSNFAVFVEEGTLNADSGWTLTNNGSVTIGTTALTFTQFTGLGQITAGTGLSKSGNTLTVDQTVIQARVTNVSDTEIGYLDGVTSAIQTQLNDKSTASKTETLTNKTISGADNTLSVRIANDVTGLGTGVATFLATPSSANLASALTDESGSSTVAFTNSPTFVTPTLGAANATSIALPDALVGSALATASTSATTIDSWAVATYSSAKYIVQMKKGTDIEVIELLVTVDGSNNVYLTEYADVISNAELGTTNAVYSGGNVLLQVTGAAADTAVKVSKTYIEA